MSRHGGLVMHCTSRVLVAAALVMLAGCGGGGSNGGSRVLAGVVDRMDLLGIPTIHAIGESSILTFEPGRQLEIKVTGNDLHDDDLAWHITVHGIAPLRRDVDYRLEFAKRPDKGPIGESDVAVIISSDYIDRIHSGDPLTVTIQIANTKRTRKFESISDAIPLIEDKVDAVRRLRVELAGWQSVQPDAAKGNLREAILPIADVLTRITRPTETSNDILDEIFVILRNIDGGKPEADTDLGAIERKLLALRNDYREFSRTNAAYSPIVASATRHFIAFSAADYRQRFLGSTVPLNEISAFPLPEAQAERLFGPIVAREFFVVALSMSNFSERDRLVNAGMIKASGRALICPARMANLGRPVFNYTVPIEVVPQSTEQVFTAVSDSKANQPREWIFRSLRFVGALATAAATGFNADLDLIKTLSLFSGVAVPGAEALWPDRVPGYLRNIVSFGMPELMKINSKSTLGHKVLFFSKEKLQLMVSDPLQFQLKEGGTNGALEQPDQFVVQLAFDSLMITYDNITSPTKGSVEERLAAARRYIEELLADERTLAQTWTDTDGEVFSRIIPRDAWKEVGDWLKLADLAGAAGGAGWADGIVVEAERKEFANLTRSWGRVHALLGQQRFRANLVGHERHGVNALLRYLQELDNAAKNIVENNQASKVYAARIEDIERAIEQGRIWLAFYRSAATALREVHAGTLVPQLLKGSDRTTALFAYNTMREKLLALVQEAKRLDPLIAPDLPKPLGQQATLDQPRK